MSSAMVNFEINCFKSKDIRQQYEVLEERPPRRPCCDILPKRYILSVMIFLGTVCSFSLRVNISVAIVAMTSISSTIQVSEDDNDSVTINYTNASILQPNSPDFDWDMETMGLVLAASYWGNTLLQIPGGIVAKRFGGTRVFGGILLTTSLLTLLTPVAAYWSVYALTTCRFCLGVVEIALFPASYEILYKWAPRHERTTLVSFGMSGCHFGSVVGMPLAGVLAKYYGWAAIFYVMGGFGVAFGLLWFSIIYKDPEHHRYITKQELVYIQENIELPTEQQKEQLSWKLVFTSLPFWSLALAMFCADWSTYTWAIVIPTFLDQVVHFDILHNGFMSAVPFLICAVLMAVAGRLADFLFNRFYISTTLLRKSYIALGLFIQALCLLASCVVLTDDVIWLFFLPSFVVLGVVWSGVFSNFIDISPVHSSIIFAVSNTISSIAGFVSPVVTSNLVNNGEVYGWQLVFYIQIAFCVIGGTIYGIFGTSEKQQYSNTIVN